MDIGRIRKFLKKYNNFLITAHINPEGDCLGAELAFAKVIKRMGKNCEVINCDTFSREYAFLPGVNNISKSPKRKKIDAAVIVDCSDISRIGSTANYLSKETPILNIDHHISNTYFGAINFVDINASSACEVLYQLFKRLRIKLDRDMAVCLYTGIVADTGSFRYPNTGALTHLVASRLLEWGIDVAMVYRNIYEGLTFLELELLNRALLDIRKDKSGKIAWVKLTHELFKKYNSNTDITENILNFLRSIRGVEVCILFKERKEKEQRVRINLRSVGKTDVNKIAQHFGGGGHMAASGITLKGVSINEAETIIISFTKKIISKAR